MRDDMPKLMCERPRVRSWAKNHNARVRDNQARARGEFEELPKRESMKKTGVTSKRHVGYLSEKYLNEYLNPLRRFLESKVGEPWDDVYSEIRENIRLDSAVQLHVMQHLFQYVEQHVYEEDGRIYQKTQYGFYKEYSELRKGEMYICPRTDILRKYGKNPYKKRDKWLFPSVIKLSHNKVLIDDRKGRGWHRYTITWKDVEVPKESDENRPRPRTTPDRETQLIRRIFKKPGRGFELSDEYKLTKKDIKRYDLD